MEHLTADEQAMKTAILEIIDDGSPFGTQGHHDDWSFYDNLESHADAQRLDFCAAVLARVRGLKTQD
jgi:hypothetical protein